MVHSTKRKTTVSTPANDGNVPNAKRQKATATENLKTPIIKKEQPDDPIEIRAKVSKSEVAQSIYDDFIFIYVGPDMNKKGIHAGLLQKYSKFFRDALMGESTLEAHEDITILDDGQKIIWLKNEDLAVFKRFNDWLYTQKVVTADENFKDLSWTLLIDVYTFAEKRGIPGLQNDCINALIRKRQSGGQFPGQAIITPLWNHEGQVWPLRRLILQFFATQCNLKHVLTRNSAFPQRFLNDLVIVMYERKVEDEKVDFWEERVKYHVYKEENPITLD